MFNDRRITVIFNRNTHFGVVLLLLLSGSPPDSLKSRDAAAFGNKDRATKDGVGELVRFVPCTKGLQSGHAQDRPADRLTLICKMIENRSGGTKVANNVLLPAASEVGAKSPRATPSHTLATP